jgi:hypothetical protein
MTSDVFDLITSAIFPWESFLLSYLKTAPLQAQTK